ncbi:hypothetical protein [Leptolyngbya sp. NIES-2104]|uniref:hypothetical protein n=1 Tax=Leptolyngbya sp. NIES-2104 TaxID=1552121 RepID=UPI0006ECA023|nr:hypothetical protein [Leptolyngbya sp. NIES-2104]GAP99371.1 hypothetical protein NIES2104_59320 [Leptolyngbya sp. NIES-2104]
MSTQRVPLEALQKIRQHFKTALLVPKAENYPEIYLDREEPPAPTSLQDLSSLFHFGGSLEEAFQMPNRQGQWFISTANPGTALMKVPSLKLKPGFRLVSYLYRIGDDGTGATWALPEQFSTTSHLEKALLTAGDRDMPPKPESALADFMDAIDGDHSPMSFVIASLLRCELLEFGKVGRIATWSHHRLLNSLPALPNWQWRAEAPKDYSPKVRVFPDGRVAVEFFSCRTVAPIAVFQHVDHYLVGQYQAKHLDRAIAISQPTNGAVKR